MIVGRAEPGERDAREEGPVGPSVPRRDEGVGPAGAAIPGQEREPQRADQEERQVRGHVEEVGHAVERALIGEVVVRGILGDGRHQGRHRDHEDAERDEEPRAPAHDADGRVETGHPAPPAHHRGAIR